MREAIYRMGCVGFGWRLWGCMLVGGYGCMLCGGYMPEWLWWVWQEAMGVYVVWGGYVQELLWCMLVGGYGVYVVGGVMYRNGCGVLVYVGRRLWG